MTTPTPTLPDPDLPDPVLPDPAQAGRDSVARLLRVLTAEGLIDSAATPGLSLPGEVPGDLTRPGPILLDGTVVSDPAYLIRALAQRGALRTDDLGNLDRFADELADSASGLRRARQGLRTRYAQAADPQAEAPFGALLTLLREGGATGATGATGSLLPQFEQLVGEGHPLHPAPRTALGMSPADAARYLPEQVTQVELRLHALAAEEAVSAGDWAAEFARACPDAARRGVRALQERGLDPSMLLIPVHPHTAEHVLPRWHADALAAGSLVDLGVRIPAAPLMGVRTLAPAESSTSHLKTALEVQLTGAVRGISPGSAHNSPRLAAVIDEIWALDPPDRTCDGTPCFDLARDRAALVRRSEPGAEAPRNRSLGAMIRDDPAAGAGTDTALPVAALTAASPVTGNPILLDLLGELGPDSAAEWLRMLAELLIPSCLSLLCRWGIALEPHPQNTVLVLREGLPHRVVVRDLGGARVLPARLARRGLTISAAPDSPLLTEDPAVLRDKLSFPLLGNLFAGLIAAAAAYTGHAETDLWREPAEVADAALRELAGRASDPAERAAIQQDADALFADSWQFKAMATMRLSGAVAEQHYVTAPNPLAPWADRTPVTEPGARLAAAIAAELPAAERETDAALSGALDREQGTTPRPGETGADSGIGSGTGSGTGSGIAALDGEAADSAANLALARARGRQRWAAIRRRAHLAGHRTLLAALAAAGSPSQVTLTLDALAIEGHNLHPLPKLRAGFEPADNLRYPPDAGRVVDLRIAAFPRSALVGTAVEDVLRAEFPALARRADAELAAVIEEAGGAEVCLVPLHPWQAEHRFAEIAEQVQRMAPFRPRLLDVTLPCRPTVSLRTLVTRGLGVSGYPLVVKTALDVQLTSTRRTISTATATTAPRLAALVASLLPDGPVRACPEIRGTALDPAISTDPAVVRGASALLRLEPSALLAADQVAVSCSALRVPGLHGGTLFEELLAAEPGADDLERAGSLVERYAGWLLGATVPLLWRHGIALEAHLQNTLAVLDPTPAGYRLTGLLLRDFAGFRVLPDQLAASGHRFDFAPGAVTIAEDPAQLYAKWAHAVIFGHLEPVIGELAAAASPDRLWPRVRAVLEQLATEYAVGDDQIAPLLAPTLPSKAFALMRLQPEGGDRYQHRDNPLALVGAGGASAIS